MRAGGENESQAAGGPEKCGVCEYDLRATPQDWACPECGAKPTDRAAAAESGRELRGACWAGWGVSLGVILAAAVIGGLIFVRSDALVLLVLIFPFFACLPLAGLLVVWLAAPLSRTPVRILRVYAVAVWGYVLLMLAGIGVVMLLVMFG